MDFVIFIIIFSIVVIVALVVVFVLFIVKGAKGAKNDKSLYEKGMITKEQYNSGFNESTKEMVQQNYEYMRKQDAAERRQQRMEEAKAEKS